MRTRASKAVWKRKATSSALMLTMLVSGVACSKNPTPNTTASSGVLAMALDAAKPLISSLMAAIPGLSELGAVLGAGSLMGLAKAKMAPAQFNQVAAAVPGVDALLAEAQKQGAPAAPSNLAAVSDFLSKKAGMSSDQVNQLTSALVSTVAGQLPSDVATAFTAALQ